MDPERSNAPMIEILIIFETYNLFESFKDFGWAKAIPRVQIILFDAGIEA